MLFYFNIIDHYIYYVLTSNLFQEEGHCVMILKCNYFCDILEYLECMLILDSGFAKGHKYIYIYKYLYISVYIYLYMHIYMETFSK